LKTDNIFVKLNEFKEISQLSIGDFDTAKKVSTQTVAKTLIGTPNYMAPEVLHSNNESAYSYQADIYSFGMVLYELLSLKLPYEGESSFRIPALVMKGQKPKLADIGNLDSSYRPLIHLYEKCASFEPETRPSTSEIKETLIVMM